MKNNTSLSPRRFVRALCTATALCACAVSAADDVRIPAVYTVPHELDCLIKAGHIQGACCSEQAIYLSHQLGIFKIGWDGKLIKSVEAPAHLGDSAYADGKIYGAFVIRNKAQRKDGKQGLVRVWDEDLNVLREAWFDEALDGIAVIGDTVYVGVDRWGHGKHDGCCIKRLTKDLKTNAKVQLGCSEGFGLVPKSVSKCDTPVFFVVKAMGGNMQGWRKDPVNNPPRIRIDFYAYANGAFKDVTVRNDKKKK